MRFRISHPDVSQSYWFYVPCFTPDVEEQVNRMGPSSAITSACDWPRERDEFHGWTDTINSIWWPDSADQFATCCILLDDTRHVQLKALIAAIHAASPSGIAPRPYVILSAILPPAEDGRSAEAYPPAGLTAAAVETAGGIALLEWKFYPLPPVRLPEPDATDDKPGLWLLPLTDIRYYTRLTALDDSDTGDTVAAGTGGSSNFPFLKIDHDEDNPDWMPPLLWYPDDTTAPSSYAAIVGNGTHPQIGPAVPFGIAADLQAGLCGWRIVCRDVRSGYNAAPLAAQHSSFTGVLSDYPDDLTVDFNVYSSYHRDAIRLAAYTGNLIAGGLSDSTVVQSLIPRKLLFLFRIEGSERFYEIVIRNNAALSAYATTTGDFAEDTDGLGTSERNHIPKVNFGVKASEAEPEAAERAAMVTAAKQYALLYYRWRYRQCYLKFPGIAPVIPNGHASHIVWNFSSTEFSTLYVGVQGIEPYRDDGDGWPGNDGEKDEDPDICDPGCGWIGGLDFDDCLTGSIVSAKGRCEDGTDDLWTAAFYYDETIMGWITDPADVLTVNGMDYLVRFFRNHDPRGGDPYLTLTPTVASASATTYYATLDCCDDCQVIFNIAVICTGDEECPPLRPTEQGVRIKIECAICEEDQNPGWDGPGWYCTSDGVVYFETDPTNCVLITSGPFETESEAEIECDGPSALGCFGAMQSCSNFSAIVTNKTGWMATCPPEPNSTELCNPGTPERCAEIGNAVDGCQGTADEPSAYTVLSWNESGVENECMANPGFVFGCYDDVYELRFNTAPEGWLQDLVPVSFSADPFLCVYDCFIYIPGLGLGTCRISITIAYDGPFYAGTVTQNADGTVSWSNTANASGAPNDVGATITFNNVATTSHSLDLTNFGITETDDPVGIEAWVRYRLVGNDVDNPAVRYAGRFIVGGTPVGSLGPMCGFGYCAVDDDPEFQWLYFRWCCIGDVTAAQLSASDFGFQFITQGGGLGTFGTFHLDAVRIQYNTVCRGEV